MLKLMLALVRLRPGTSTRPLVEMHIQPLVQGRRLVLVHILVRLELLLVVGPIVQQQLAPNSLCAVLTSVVVQQCRRYVLEQLVLVLERPLERLLTGHDLKSGPRLSEGAAATCASSRGAQSRARLDGSRGVS